MVYKFAKATRNSNTWITTVRPISEFSKSYSSAEKARQSALELLKKDVQKVGWVKVSSGINGYLIYKDSSKYAYVYAWSRQNPNKGHGYGIWMLKSDVYYELDSNGQMKKIKL